MKKVLVLHNSYQNLGGEDIAVENEISFLRKHFELETLFFTNNISSYIAQFIYLVFNKNFSSMKILKNKIQDFNPDIVYVHNTWFKASIGIFKILLKNNLKVFIKLHNFRYYCTKSYFSKNHLGNNQRCNACGLNKNEIGMFNKYFIDSYFKSFLVNRYGRIYYKLLKNSNIQLIVLTEFHKQFLQKLGINNKRIITIPNYLHVAELKNSVDNLNLVYAGRISREKGIYDLIISFQNSKLRKWNLNIIGTGPLLDELIQKYKSFENIKFIGEKSNQEVLSIISKSNAVVTATSLYEGQPTLLCEASFLGIPSIFPKSGGIEEFFPINYELSYQQNNNIDLVNKLNLLEDLEGVKKIGLKNQDFINNYLNSDKILNKFKNSF